jgi:hypothetical protein
MARGSDIWTGRAFIIVVTSVALALTIGETKSTLRGCCPQTTDGWVLFDDNNPRVPDFWWADSVIVRTIDVCSHGIHFFFFSEEDGQPRYVALVIVKPTRELFETRVPCRLGDASLATRLERATRRYADLVATLERLFEVRFSPEGRIDFVNRPLPEFPIISQPRGLTLRWRGTEIKLRGYLDVYMTMFS